MNVQPLQGEKIPTFGERWRESSWLQKTLFLVIPISVVIFMLSEYRPGQKIYAFTMSGNEGNTVLEFALGRIVFEGVAHNGETDGDIPINGWGSGEFYVNEGKSPVWWSTRRGITTIHYADYTFALTDDGRTLRYGRNSFRLGPDKPTILLAHNGIARILTNY